MSSAPSATSPHGSKSLVALIAEDSRIQAKILENRLQQAGYTVQVAHDGAAALELARKLKPDVIISDIEMPRMTGYELCARLRDDPHTEQIPVLMLSARGETPHVKEGLRAGADDYLPKPFDPEELVLRVNALLRRAGVLLRA